MAEDQDQARTEAPSPRRRERAREQGQVAVSNDLSAGVLLLAGTVGLMLVGHAMGAGLLAGMRFDLLHAIGRDFDTHQAETLLTSQLGRGLEIVGLFLGIVLLAGVVASVAQVGLHPSWGSLGFKWDKLSPGGGLQRIISLATLMRGLTTLLKFAVVVALVCWVVSGDFGSISTLMQGRLADTVSRSWNMILHLSLVVAIALTVVGVLDYLYQRWRLEQSLLMTKQEKKDEMKEEEGNPQVKARRRKMQREVAQNRMFQDVRTASVVITNPTHLAIALRYDRNSAAPRVVAKGAGSIAEQLIRLARDHAVPVVERKPLAQALFKAVKVNQEIPTAMFQAVAEVLAYIHRMRGGLRALRGA